MSSFAGARTVHCTPPKHLLRGREAGQCDGGKRSRCADMRDTYAAAGPRALVVRCGGSVVISRRAAGVGGMATLAGAVLVEPGRAAEAAAAVGVAPQGDTFWDSLDLGALPQYPGYITLPSGLQIREGRLGLGAAPAAECGDTLTVRWRAWAVHQGRTLGPWQPCTFVLACPSDSGAEVIPAWHEGLRGIRPGGVRRLLVPPLPCLSYPYQPLQMGVPAPEEDDTDGGGATAASAPPLTKLNMAPVVPFEVGAQSLAAGVGPVPADPKGRAFLEKVVSTNAFTIKLPDRAVLFEVERLNSDGTRAAWVSAGSSDVALGAETVRAATANARGGDGGASWWTLTLPPMGEGD